MELQMYRGDSRRFAIRAFNAVGGPFNLTGGTLRFTAKTAKTLADNQATFTKTTGAGITVTDGAGGLAEVAIAPTDTSALTADTTLLWDLQHKAANGDVTTLAEGTLFVRLDVSVTA